jgi:hypothetical protein
MRSPCCLCVCVSPYELLNARPSLYENWRVYHGTWAHLNGALHGSLPSLCLYPSTVARQRLGKHSPAAMNTRNGKRNYWARRFLNSPYFIKGVFGSVCVVVGGMRIARGNRSTRRKPAPVPLCPPQIPHDLTWDRTRTAAAGSRRLTAWAMARPTTSFTQSWRWRQYITPKHR